MRRTLARAGTALFVLAFAAAAFAGQRTFVASHGSDTNPCSLGQPCRGFASAVAQTSAGGEVIVLDSAGYGPVTITQSVSIIAPRGVYAGISVLSGDGVTVAAGPGDRIVLRGLTINGQGGNRGVIVSSAGEVHVEYCNVANMVGPGVSVGGGTRGYIRNSMILSNLGPGLTLTSDSSGSPDVYLTDSQFSENGGSGILVEAGTLVATRIAVESNLGNGIQSGQMPPVPVAQNIILTDSVVTGNLGRGAQVSANWKARWAFLRSSSVRNGGDGIDAEMGLGEIFLVVADSYIVDNGDNGIRVTNPKATAVLSGSTIAGHTFADIAQLDPAMLRTSENNTLTGRGATDVSGLLTPNPLK